MYQALAEAISEFHTALECTTCPEDRAMVSDYLAALAPLLARATLGRDILRDIPAIERLFGQASFIDVHPFESAFRRWREFVVEYSRHALSALTVNERLVATGQLDDFDAASKRRDFAAMRDILRRIYLDDASIEDILRRTNDA
jgi:hypothetical protein